MICLKFVLYQSVLSHHLADISFEDPHTQFDCARLAGRQNESQFGVFIVPKDETTPPSSSSRTSPQPEPPNQNIVLENAHHHQRGCHTTAVNFGNHRNEAPATTTTMEDGFNQFWNTGRSGGERSRACFASSLR